MVAKKTGVKVYVLTVDSETHAVLKTEEEDPNTGKRAEAQVDFVQAGAAGGLPSGFVPSVVIWVGGGAAVVQQAPGGLGAQFAPQTVIGQAGIVPTLPRPPLPQPPRVTSVVTPKPPKPPKENPGGGKPPKV